MPSGVGQWAQQTSSEYAHESGGPIALHVVFAEYPQIPPASAQAGSVSADGGAQRAAWHLPPRQRPPPPKQKQLQDGVWPAKAIAFAIAVMYFAMAPLLIASVGQPSHVRSGHEDTSPTVLRAWRRCIGAGDAAEDAPASGGIARAARRRVAARAARRVGVLALARRVGQRAAAGVPTDRPVRRPVVLDGSPAAPRENVARYEGRPD